MGKAPYAILGLVAVVVIGFALYLYSLTGSGWSFASLLLLTPFAAFGVGIKMLNRR